MSGSSLHRVAWAVFGLGSIAFGIVTDDAPSLIFGSGLLLGLVQGSQS